jgi:hypothetical protein
LKSLSPTHPHPLLEKKKRKKQETKDSCGITWDSKSKRHSGQDTTDKKDTALLGTANILWKAGMATERLQNRDDLISAGETSLYRRRDTSLYRHNGQKKKTERTRQHDDVLQKQNTGLGITRRGLHRVPVCNSP